VTTPTPFRLICVVPNPSIDRTAEVDRLEPGRIHRPDEVVAVPGGKGLNVARAARHLGVPVEAVLLLAGHAGRWIAEELDRLDIPYRAAWSAGETRSCLSVLDRSTDLLTEVYEPGPVVAAAAWDDFLGAIEGAVAAAGSGGVVALSGSLPRGTPDGAAATIAAAGSASGGRVIVDTSGANLVAALGARPFMVKVNASEAGAALGREVATEAEAVEAARELVMRGAGRAIVTRGGAGAIGWDGADAWAVDAPPGGRQTVGSGDAFLAGYAAGLSAVQAFPDCLRRAAAAAAASTRVPGPGNLEAADADRLLEHAAVRPLR
jgi:1-phosphofructokinase family hexose kinase